MEERSNELSFPLRLEVTESFSVTVYFHSGGPASNPFPCWTYVSSGLSEYGQKELIFTLKKSLPEEDPIHNLPAMPIQFISMVLADAQNGTIVKEGSTATFGTAGFLGHSTIGGVAFVSPHYLQHQKHSQQEYHNQDNGKDIQIDEGITIDPHRRYLFMVTLDVNEIVVAMEYGVARIMAMIGKLTQSYPYPLWSDPGRPSVIQPSAVPLIEQSVVGKMRRVKMMSTSANLVQKNVIFNIPVEEKMKFQRIFSEVRSDEPVCIFLEYDFSVDGHLVWDPTDPNCVSAISPNPVANTNTDDITNIELSGSFIAFCLSEEEKEYQILIIEDGFVILLSPHYMQSLQASLQGGTPFPTRSDPNSPKLIINWKTEESSKKEFELVNVTLLTPESEIAASEVSPDQLAATVKQLVSKISSLLAKKDWKDLKNIKLLIECWTGNKVSVNIQLEPNNNEIDLQEIKNETLQVLSNQITVSTRSVGFLLILAN